jgi:hypothetical protein
MLGVAPQAGGLTPPPPEHHRPDRTSVPPSDSVPPPPPETPRAAPVEASPARATDPFAGTEAMPSVPSPEPEPRAPAPTQPLAAVTRDPVAREAVADEDVASEPLPFEHTPAPERAQTSKTEPPQMQRNIQATVALPVQTAASPSQPKESSLARPPRRRAVSPLEIFLIVATCGLYGLFLLAKQRGRSES